MLIRRFIWEIFIKFLLMPQHILILLRDVSRLKKGDVIYISNTDGDEVLKAGDKYKDYNAIVNEIFKEPKRWWQFWKKPKVLGYQIMFL